MIKSKPVIINYQGNRNKNQPTGKHWLQPKSTKVYFPLHCHLASCVQVKRKKEPVNHPEQRLHREEQRGTEIIVQGRG